MCGGTGVKKGQVKNTIKHRFKAAGVKFFASHKQQFKVIKISQNNAGEASKPTSNFYQNPAKIKSGQQVWVNRKSPDLYPIHP